MISFLDNPKNENLIQNNIISVKDKINPKLLFSPKNVKERACSNSQNNQSNVDVTWNEILLNLKVLINSNKEK